MSERQDASQVAIPEKHVDIASSALWMAFGAVVIWQALKLEYRDEFGPSAGFFPLWLGVIAVALGALLGILAALKRAQAGEIVIASRSAAVRMLLVAAALFVFVSLMNGAGFFLASGLLFFFLLFAVEKQSAAYSLIAAVVAFVALWLIFEVALKVQLPVGFMKFLRVI